MYFFFILNLGFHVEHFIEEVRRIDIVWFNNKCDMYSCWCDGRFIVFENWGKL